MGTITKLVTDADRQAAAIDQVADVVDRSILQINRNIHRRHVWRKRFHKLTGVWPSHHSAYPTKED